MPPDEAGGTIGRAILTVEAHVEYIKNTAALTSDGEARLKKIALDIVENAISAADPGKSARKLVRLDKDTLCVGSCRFELSADNRIFVIGAGKASFPVAKALDDILGERIHKGLVTCKNGQEGALKHIELHCASHPIPCSNSLAAAERTEALLKEVRSGDIILACISGGSSSLLVSPVAGISLEDKARTSQVLLTCGANIIEINAVRKHLSRIKGGRLIKNLPAGTRIINLTVSDVIGDYLDYITDPTVPDTSTFADAIKTLDTYHLWSVLPQSVTDYIRKAPQEDETAKVEDLAHIIRTDIILQKADAACIGAADAARNAGLAPVILSTFFEGESHVLGKNFAAIARQVLFDGNPQKSPCVLIGGGETTVTFNGNAGQGGPNQEFVASAALELRGVPGVVVVGFDTDGTDGPTSFAGAIADGFTAEKVETAGESLCQALREHNISPALSRINATIITGNTGTNVNDLKILIVAP